MNVKLVSITQKELKDRYYYNPENGEFHSLIRNYATNKPAGHLDPQGYIRIGLLNKSYKAHRLAWLYMTGEWPKQQIDHKDRNKSNNSFINLREATNSQNMFNRKLNTKQTSGVIWHKATGKWAVVISINKVRKHLGLFSDLELAELVAVEARSKHHKEFFCA